MQNKIVHSITGLRAACFIAVISLHTLAYKERIPYHESVHSSGWQGVTFFFVLSGYLVTKHVLMIIQSNKQDPPKRFLGRPLIEYYIRRIIRLYPPYIVFVLIAKFYFNDYQDYSIWEILLFRRQINAHVWTQMFELFFSIILGPAMFVCYAEFMILMNKLFSSKYNTIYCILFHTFPIIYTFNYVSSLPYIENLFDYKEVYFPNLVIFYYGILGAQISHWIELHDLKPKINTKRREIIYEVCMWLLMSQIILSNNGVQKNFLVLQDQERPYFYSQLVFSPVYVLFLIILEIDENKCFIGRFFNLPLIKYIGKISYSAFLFHVWAINYVVYNTNIMDVEFLESTIVGAIIFGTIGFYTVEAPSLKLMKYLIKISRNVHLKNCLPSSIYRQHRPLYNETSL